MKILGKLPVAFLLSSLMLLSLGMRAQEINQQVSKPIAGYIDPIYGVDHRLVSGITYIGPRRGSISGHPYVINEEWKTGSALMDGVLFDNILLKYDVEQNDIVLKYSDFSGSVNQVAIKKEKVDQFTLGDRIFIPYPLMVEFDSTYFCELIEQGEIDYLVLRTKTFMLTNGAEITDYIYRETTKQYLVIEENLIPFKSKGDLYKLYPQFKQDIKRFIRSNDLAPKKANIADRQKMVSYCNQLIGGQN